MCIEVIRLLVVKDGGTEIRNGLLDPAATTPLVKDDDSRPPVATAEEVVTGRARRLVTGPVEQLLGIRRC